MCFYNDIFGEGTVLQIQILTIFSIAAAILFWVWMYNRDKIGLRIYAIPIILWILFGTLDALMTAKGAYGDPMREANPLTKFAILQWGWLGLPIASILWVSLWSVFVFALNKFMKNARFFSLSVFYSLAIGHLWGFGSWFVPLCAIGHIFKPDLFGLLEIILAGCIIAFAHIRATSTKNIL